MRPLPSPIAKRESHPARSGTLRADTRSPMFVDSHCHLDFPEFAAELPALLDAMAAASVTHALCIGVNLPDWPAVHALAASHPNLYATVGVHPDAGDTTEPTVDALVALAGAPQGDRDRRDRSRLLPAHRRSRLAARAFSRARARGAAGAKAAGDPHALFRRRHACRNARRACPRRGRRDALLHGDLGSRARGARSRLSHFHFRHRHVQERARRARTWRGAFRSIAC